MRRALWLAALLLVGCEERAQELRPAQNRCVLPGECGSDRCDEQLQICVRDEATVPYEIVMLVTPSAAVTVGDAGAPRLVSHQAQPAYTVTRSVTRSPIRVRSARTVTGRVLATARALDPEQAPAAEPIEAELVFTAQRDDSALVDSISAFTVRRADGHGYTVALEPDTAYEVTVYPLGEANERFPPATFSLPENADAPYDFRYEPLLPLRFQLLEETLLPPAPQLRLRLVDQAREEVASSVGYSDRDGGVQLEAPQRVLDQLSDYRLMVGTRRIRMPWREAILFEGESLRDGATLVIPTIPEPVLFEGRVEALQDEAAELTFVSSFPVPPPAADVRGRDWCRLRALGSLLPRFTCRASHRVSAAGGRVAAELLPGDYRVYFATGAPGNARRAATKEQPVTIDSQDGGVQGGLLFQPASPTVYEGHVRSPFNEPMPLVQLSAVALGVPLPGEPLTGYARSTQATSNAAGLFSLALDTGFYDLIAVPPENSGYPAVLQDSRFVRAEPMDFRVTAQIPVVLRGTVVTERDLPLADAVVEAYAVVPEIANPERRRTVRIARTSSDGRGAYVLLLPASIGDVQPVVVRDGGPPAVDAGLDAASANDADADRVRP